MFVTIWNYLKGYVIVEVSGAALEKFMNLAIYHEIYIWDVHRVENKIYFKTSIKDFKRLKPEAKKARCRMRITTKKGLPFKTHRYKKRKAFMLGIGVFIAMIWVLSSFVWLVEVEGNKRITSLDIINALEEQGYRSGKLKGQMNLREAETYLLEKYPEIVWTGIRYEGTRLVVKVAESIPVPEMYPKENEPSNLIAKRDALITYIAVYKGKPTVKAGDIVKKGDVLVAGEMPLGEESTNPYYTKSKAKVSGKTMYTASGEISTTHIKKNYTNDISKKYTLKIFNRAFTLFDQKIPFETYDKQITLHQLSITKLFPLPFALEVETRVAYTPSYEELTEEEAQDKLLSKLWEDIRGSLSEDAVILKREAFFVKKGNAITGTLHVTAEEDIGYEVVIQSEGEIAQ